MAVDVDDAFAFFADASNLEAITPPWLRFRILEAPMTLERGSLLVYRLRLFGLHIRWRTEIVEWRPPFGFTDVQLAGPYRRWEHTHRLRRVGGGTEIYDHVVYRLPYEPLAGLLAPLTVRPWLTAIFDYRARQTEARLGGSARPVSGGGHRATRGAARPARFVPDDTEELPGAGAPSLTVRIPADPYGSRGKQPPFVPSRCQKL